VATNEFEEPWMDEGMDDLCDSQSSRSRVWHECRAIYILGLDLFYWPFAMPHPLENRLLTLKGPFTDPIVTPSWKYYDSTSYAINAYPRSVLALGSLERYLGEAAMNRSCALISRGGVMRIRHPMTSSILSGNEWEGLELVLCAVISGHSHTRL
jgi:hypothetical protein